MLTGRKKYPKLEDILYCLDVSSICPEYYRSIYYSKTSLIKSLLLIELLGQSQSEFERYLEKKAIRKKKLGLGLNRKRPPDQTTISKFKKKMVNDEVKELLHFTVQKIRENATKNNIVFNIETETTTIKKRRTSKQKDEISISWISRHEIRKIAKKIEPFIPLEIAKNSIYTKKEYVALMLYMAQGSTYANSAIKDLREEKKQHRMFCPRCYNILFPLSDRRNEIEYENIMFCQNCGYEKSLVPDSDTLFYHIKKPNNSEKKDDNIQENLQKLQHGFSVANEVIFNRLNEIQNEQKAVNIKIGLKDDIINVTIDETERFFYGNINSKNLRGYVTGKKPERGTTYCIKFVASDAIGSRRRITLDAVPFRQNKKVEIIRELLTSAQGKTKIDNVILDKGFWDQKIFNLIDELKLNYLIPCKRSPKNKKNDIDVTAKNAPIPWYYPDQKLGNTTYNKIVVKKKIKGREVILEYATNKNFSNITEAVEYTDLYPSRWGVETGFRVKKHAFLPKTTSTNMKVNLFYFLFTVLLYNLWYLADTLVWLNRYKTVGEKRLITANHFRTIFRIIMEDAG
jgi:DNA-directed RNA polymerase subunit M/transcription elongation factor TFIIS